MSDLAIRLQNLSKLYRIGEHQRGYKTLRESIMGTLSAPFRHRRSAVRGQSSDTIWALKDISFEVKRGEVVGIIGRNGAGKTTLLKILSRITEPTEGRAEIHGRVGSLLEVGTGFHPELTGRENIYLNGAILGMRKTEIERKFDEIVDFAEIEKFIDTPVKRYSSGMYVRLAFAVAAHLEPDILLVDEVLAVGDAAFQKKCLGKMGDVAKEARTVLFVSHNMQAVADLCPRTMWIDDGSVRREGQSEVVIGGYLSSGFPSTGYWCRPKNIADADELELLEAKVCKIGNSSATSIVTSNEPFCLEILYKVKSRVRGCSIIVHLMNMNGLVVFTTWDTDSNATPMQVRDPGLYRSVCRVPEHLLRPSRYSVTIAAIIYGDRRLDFQQNIMTFDISDVGFRFNKERQGIVVPIMDWTIEKNEG